MNKKTIIIALTEIRDNVPAIWEAEDQSYYSMLTDIIEYMEG